MTTFSINVMFRNMAVRIIGTPFTPFFYACDLGAVLGIPDVSSKMRTFSEKDIVSPEMRERYGLVTYRNDGVASKKVALLTEKGAYRLIFTAKSAIAEECQDRLCDILIEIRHKETEKLRVLSEEQNRAMSLLLAKKDEELEQKNKILNKINKYNPIVLQFSKVIGDDNAYSHVMKRDREVLLFDRPANSPNGYKRAKRGVLYKYTTAPTPEDYEYFTFDGEVYGDTDAIMNDVQDDCMSISSRAAKTSVYTVHPVSNRFYFVRAADLK
jgi:prophage antirepressor-like protein